MVTIEIIGMDRYMLYDYSHDITKNLANILETSEEEIFFAGGDTKLVHDGNDQTSWHALVRVNVSEKYHRIEKQIADFLLTTITDYVLNAHIIFEYYDSHHEYHKYNEEYSRFLIHNEDNDIEYNYEDVDDEEIYDGNVFEGFEEKLEKAEKEKCGHDCDCHSHDDD